MFVPESWLSNPYRILRISASATASEIHQAAAAMRRLVRLDMAKIAPVDLPALGPLPRSEADIQAAVGRLGNATQRLADRLFWFQPTPANLESVPGRSSHAAIRRHDEALQGLYAALGAKMNTAGIAIWTRSLRAWFETMNDDEYWAASLEIEEMGGFEPGALPSEVDSLRKEAAARAAEPLIVAARDALAHDDMRTAVRVAKAIEGLSDTGVWASTTLNDLASVPADRLKTLCLAIDDQLKSQVVREATAGPRNLKPCDAALKRFRSEVQPAMNRLLQLIPNDHKVAQQVREHAALCLNQISRDYTWADDFIMAEKLREEALALAGDTLASIQIHDGFEQVRQGARQQRVYGAPITRAPSLSTFNGIGNTLYGYSDYDAETQSYSTTNYFVVMYIPLFPEGRYRVVNLGGQRYRFLGKLPLRKADRWHTRISLTVIFATIIGMLIAFNIPTSSSSERRMSAEEPSSSAEPSSASEPNPPAQERDSDSTYLSPPLGSQADLDLASLKEQIEAGRIQMQGLELKLKPIKVLETRLEALTKKLKAMDDQSKAGKQSNLVDYYEAEKEYKAILSRMVNLVDANRAALDRYKELEKQDKVMVDKYNSILRSAQ